MNQMPLVHELGISGHAHEMEIRALRDRVFVVPTTDKNWDACREKWLRPDSIAWLKAHDFPIGRKP